MKNSARFALCALIFTLVGCSRADVPSVSDLLISDSSVRATRSGTPSSVAVQSGPNMVMAAEPVNALSSAYLRIENRSGQEDRLLSVTTDVAERAEVHQTIVENDVARMQHMIDGVIVPATGVLEFRPGGLHIMLIGLKRELVPGQYVQLTLNFAVRGAISVSVPVIVP